MIKAFIFDFDGLIIDTENACLQSWLEQYQKYNIKLPLSKWELTIGTSNEAFDPLEYLYESTNKSFDKQKLLSDQKKSYLQKTRLLPLLPGIMNYLIWAKQNNIKIGLASSSTKAWVVPHLLDLKILPFFNVIMTADDVKNVKPNPELFLSVKNNLKILDFEAVVFEDSQNGIIAGNLANLFTIAVPNSLTKNLDLSEAYFTLNSLDIITPQNLVKILETGLK
jgi:HAD superfamily hydrolase (TIGR01509 family)